MRRFVLMLVAAAFMVWERSWAVPPPVRPNIIIVLVDDAGYGDWSCLGNPVVKTPSVDRLHRESIRFTDFHVAPMCTPTRSQLMTGLDCLRNGAMNVSSGRTPLRLGISTMADFFAAGGYRTGHFGKWHLGDNYPYRPEERGFHRTIHHKSWGISSAADYFNNDYFDDFFWTNEGVRVGERLIQSKGYCTDYWFDEAMKWMNDCAGKKQPFLCYLPLNSAHGPLFVPDQYRAPYRNQARNVASFFGMVANIDENMGKLDAWLSQSGLRENTILIFMTDNGATAGANVFNAGMRGRKQELYEGGHRVPCFVRWPGGGLRSPGDINYLSHCQDMLPTLIELCALKRPTLASPAGKTVGGEGFDGISLAGLLRGKGQTPDRTLVVQYSRLQGQRPQKGDACVMWKRWRLVGDRELFDLDNDPAQMKNVIAAHPDIVAKLRAHYDQWWAGVEPRLDEFQPIHVGNDAENPVRLAPGDWQDEHCDQSAQARRGEKKNAPWNLYMERDGEYEIALRRYPKEADLPITAGATAYQGVDGQLPECKALPIAKARLRIGDFEAAKPVTATDKAIAFTTRLKKGRAQLQTWFYDAGGEELCGAYYTEVRRK